MLLLVDTGEESVSEALPVIRDLADAIVLGEKGKVEVSATEMTSSAGDMIIGARFQPGVQVPESLAESGYDFVICGVDGSLRLLGVKGVGCMVQVGPGVESNRLRAIGDVGAEAIVLTADSLDMMTVDTAIECRRMRTVSGRPIILHLSSPVSAEQVGVLWRAGVDALLVGLAEDMELLTATRAAIDAASYESRSSSSDAAVSIGANIAGMNAALEEEEDGEEEDGGEEDDG